mgnify:CR=1 FL=1
MIELYYWTTPNGHKMTMFLEETGMPYTIHPVNIGKGDQFKPEFLKISPNNRIPAMVDHAPADGGEPIAMFESGAMLLVSRRQDRALHSARHRAARLDCIQWLFWQMGNLGPMAGQNHHFVHYAPEKLPYAIDRYVNETGRLYARAQQASCRPRVHRRRIHRRRHGELSLGAARAAEPEHRRVSASEALERSHQGAPGDASSLRQKPRKSIRAPAAFEPRARKDPFGQTKDVVR